MFFQLTHTGMANQHTQKLRVLCLHGYRQNSAIFRERSGALRKLIRKHVDFVFINAPHVIPEPVNLSRPEDQQERGWWFSRPEKAYNAQDTTDVLLGYDETVKLICEVFESQGPFDGVLGFSQGASLVSLLCILQTDPNNPIHFKFAILIAGFKSLVSAHLGLYKAPIDCPSFHTIGESDAVIPSQSSEDLLGVFVNGVPYRHSGGHYVPASLLLRTAIIEFITPLFYTTV